MLQEAIGVKNPAMAFGPFIDAAVAASQTDAQLVVVGVANDGIVMPKAGHIVGLLWTLSAAASAGTLTIGASIDGTENANTRQTVTTAVEGYAAFKTNDVAPRFAAGNQIGVEITTDGSWNATTADLAVWLVVAFENWEM